LPWVASDAPHVRRTYGLEGLHQAGMFAFMAVN
jgi:hypothetical protein